MFVAVIGDLHGLVWEGLRLAVRLEQELGERLAAVLCTGDLGFFPDVRTLDRATRRHASTNPDELGFLARFAQRTPEVEAWLQALPHSPPPLYFVRGNHEDHFILEAHERRKRIVPVDAYGLLHYLPDNATLTLRGRRREMLRVTALGGIELCNPLKYHPLRKIQDAGATAVLARAARSVDVLLTHDGPTGLREVTGSAQRRPGRDWGSEVVDLVVEGLRPEYHVFGHWHLELPKAERNGTVHCHMNIVRGRQHQATLSRHSLGLLRWGGPKDHGFAYVEDGWLEEWRWAPPVRLDVLPPW